MDFTPASQNGIIPPSELKYKESRLGLAVSSTSTVYGNEIIFKGISDAAMWKTEPVTYYRITNSSTVSIGTGSWINTNTNVLVSTSIGTGTHQLYATWPGEGLYAPQSTLETPVPLTVAAGYQLGATISHTVTPASNTLVTGEGTATFRVSVSTSTVLTDTLSFYIGNTFYGQAPFVNNTATFAFSELPEGALTIRTNWPGATIGGKTYEGFTYNISYTVKSGTDIGQSMTLVVTPQTGVINEGSFSLAATINTSTAISVGNVKFYVDNVLIDTSPVTANQATTSFPNTFAVGNRTFRADYDGNATGHPRYFSFSAPAITVPVAERDTATLTLSDSPDPTLVDRESITLTAELDEVVKIPGGTVTFYDGATTLGTAPMTTFNRAVFTATNLTTGTHTLRAYWSGSASSPKFYGTYSNYTTATVVNVLPYPGTMTLSGASSINELSNQTFTLTGSVNTQTVGLATLYQFNPLYTTSTTTTSNISTSTVSSGASLPSSRTTSTTVNSVGTSSIFNTLTQTTQIYPTAISVTVSTSTNYTNFRTSSFDRTAYQIISRKGSGNSSYSIALISQSAGNQMIYGISGVVRIQGTNYTITSINNTPTPGDVLVYFTPPFGGISPTSYAADLYYYGLKTLTFPSYLATATQIITTSTSISAVSSLVYKEVSTATFTGSNTLKFYPDGIRYQSNSQFFTARWNGQGYAIGQTPYLGTGSNVLSQTITFGAITLSGTNSNVVSLPNTFTVTANTSSVASNTVNLYANSNFIASSSITSGSNISITVPAGNIPVGTNTIISEIILDNEKIIRSNSVSLTILPKATVTSTITLSTSSYNFYNTNGTTNTSVVTATVAVVGGYSQHLPTGNITLYANNTVVSTSTITSTLTNITFVPSNYSQAGTSLIFKADYSGDDWTSSSTSTSTIFLNKIKPIISITTSNQITTGSYVGQRFGPESYRATFAASSSAPSNVNWLINGNFVNNTPVISGSASLNNFAVNPGTHYVSITYDETSVYDGTSYIVTATQASSYFPPGQNTLTSVRQAYGVIPEYEAGAVRAVWTYTPPTDATSPYIPTTCKIFVTNVWLFNATAIQMGGNIPNQDGWIWRGGTTGYQKQETRTIMLEVGGVNVVGNYISTGNTNIPISSSNQIIVMPRQITTTPTGVVIGGFPSTSQTSTSYMIVDSTELVPGVASNVVTVSLVSSV
jgi:hypothetical protein